MDYQSLADLFLSQAKHYQERPVFQVKQQGAYHHISWTHALRHIALLAVQLDRFGVKRGDSVAILSENRPEWAYADFSILSLGAVVVPLFPTASVRDIEFILTHSDARVLFISNHIQLSRISTVIEHLSGIQKIIVFDDDTPSHANDRVVSFRDFLGAYTQEGEINRIYEYLVRQVNLDQLATIIYTSGTTGSPKGVMLSHRNILINCYDSKKALPITERDIMLSFLPLSHVFQRMAGHFLMILCGGTIAFAEDINQAQKNIIEVKPTIMPVVPRFFEKIYAKVREDIDRSPVYRKKIVDWAIQTGKEASQHRFNGKPLSNILLFKYLVAKLFVFRKLYRKLGGRIRFYISGGAPLSKDLGEFFYALGMMIVEGYGLTETAPVISVNRLDQFKFGSVGLPLKSVEVKLAEDGEIMARGPNLMMGYYKDEKSTYEAIKDNWIYTGDLGIIDKDGFLFISGRKKDLIITSGGKNICPQNIENAILSDSLISQVVMVGNRRPYVTALVVPNYDQLKIAVKALGLGREMTPEELIRCPEIHQLIASCIDERIRDFAPYEKIKYFTLIRKEFCHEDGEVTLTLKNCRRVIESHYQAAIDRMYEETKDLKDGRKDRIFYVV